MDLPSCICCWTGINCLLYLACAIVQWILIGNERADGVACLNGVALAGAILLLSGNAGQLHISILQLLLSARYD